MSKSESSKPIISYRNHNPDLYCYLCRILRKFLSKYIWQRASFKTLATLNTVTSLTANSIMDISLQISQRFQKEFHSCFQGAHFLNE